MFHKAVQGVMRSLMISLLCSHY